MTFGSMFAGIGGFDLGLEAASMQCKWQMEIDPLALSILEHHWPSVKRYGDVTEINWEEVEQVDCICAGFPCQPVSQVGRKLAQSDSRWLWPSVAQAICALRPKYALLENVTGLLSRGMGIVLADLSQIGFDAEWQTVPAQALGAPHQRERVFIVAYPQGQRRSEIQVFTRKPQKSNVWGGGQLHTGQDGSRVRYLPPFPFRSVAHGVPYPLVRPFGNAVVPQVAEYLGGLIVEHHRRVNADSSI